MMKEIKISRLKLRDEILDLFVYPGRKIIKEELWNILKKRDSYWIKRLHNERRLSEELRT